MKALFLSLTLLFAIILTASAQKNTEWPRNPRTGNIEFIGKHTFTGEAAKPENIQRFVREWVAKHTDDSQIASQGRFSDKGTYYEGLVIEQPNAYKLLFMCLLSVKNGSLQYRLEKFTCIFPEGQIVHDVPLEALLESDSTEHWQAIQEFHKRVNAAVVALK